MSAIRGKADPGDGSPFEMGGTPRVRKANYLTASSAIHCRSNVPTHGIARGFHRIVGKVSIARRCRWLRVTEHLANYNETLPAGSGHACKRMAQVVQPHVLSFLGARWRTYA